MKRAAMLGALAVVTVGFAINYNSSKSNSGNIVVAPDFVTKSQAAAVLADLEKSGKTPDETAVRAAMKKHGVAADRIREVHITGITSGGGSKGYGILLLENASDESTARAELARATGMKQGKYK